MIAEFLNQNIPGCPNFYWREVLLQKNWALYAFPSSRIENNLIETMVIMENIRRIFGDRAITVTSGWRALYYNIKIGGAKRSAHIDGMACDFVVSDFEHGKGCDEVRAVLLDHLDDLNICMEDKPGSDWVHIDRRLPRKNGGRFFKP